MRGGLTRAVPSTGCAVAALLALAGCGRAGGPDDGRAVITFPGSAVGEEGALLRRQARRFERAHPGVAVRILDTPDSADERHQLYVQWLNAGVGDPDVLQLDVIWVPELAAAGWILPLERFEPSTDDVFEGVLAAARWRDRLFAAPWFVDVGMLYFRTDLLERAPRTFDELAREARRARRAGEVRHGLIAQLARYEGLVTVFLEVLGGFGGRILDERGRVVVDDERAVAALRWLRDAVGGDDPVIPEAALTWREEQSRFAFQNGEALLMRNWPYAYPLLDDASASRVAGRFAVAPMPATAAGEPTAALGGSHLAINAHGEHPEAAWALVRFLTAPEQMRERARVTGQLPPRPSLYDDPDLARALPIPPEQARRVIERARPRPVTPVYTELSSALQVELHRALTGQATPREALARAAERMRRIQAAADRARGEAPAGGGADGAGLPAGLLAALAVAACAVAAALAARRLPTEARLAWAFVTPAVVLIAVVAIFPLAFTGWESLHRHDLRLPGQGRPFVGLENYREALAAPRFWGAMAHTGFFVATSVAIELVLGLGLALALDRAFRGRGLVRATTLLPWALPTVVAALVFRFLFEGEGGAANAALLATGLVETPPVWFGDAVLAWVPLVLADVWKTTPFVALLLLAGLQTIDRDLLEAARIDGAGAWSRLYHVTLPLLRPTIVVAVLFRSLDAFRVFGLVWVMTGGGPGTATEPIAVYTHAALLQNLRFGYGSALSVIVFAVTFVLAALYLRAVGGDLLRSQPR